MKNYSAKTVEEYIASASTEARKKLREVRLAVRTAVPKAEEKISWGVPFYWQCGALVGYGAGNGYVLFGLAFALDAKDRALLEKKGYATGKKTFKIGFDQAVPVTVIRRMLKARAQINQAAKK